MILGSSTGQAFNYNISTHLQRFTHEEVVKQVNGLVIERTDLNDFKKY